MSKAAYYFPHDYGARSDRKLVRLRHKYGLAGIGAYWCLIEMLYEENGYIALADIPLIAKELHCQIRVLSAIIGPDFDLFHQDSDRFWSDSQLIRMEVLTIRRKKAQESALAKWYPIDTKRDANAERTHMRTQSERYASKESKESKERKERKEKKEPPIIPLQGESAKAPFSLPAWIDKTAWDAFEEMRKKKRAPLTDNARSLLIKTLEKLRNGGNDVTEIINQSVMNAWSGFFPMKTEEIRDAKIKSIPGNRPGGAFEDIVDI